MGKTATIAMLAMKHANGEEGMDRFDFVWTVKLQNVEKTSSLAEIVKKQHHRIKDFPTGQIKSILEGRLESKVALLFDGYDEYQPGRNKEIDNVLQSGNGNSFIILTSRPGYVDHNIRRKMDYEVTIEGLSVRNIKKCSKLYLDSKKKSLLMLKQANAAGIYKSSHRFFQRVFSPSSLTDDALLRIPIILLMICFIYEENQSLPHNRTNILKTLYKLLGDRSAIKMSGCISDKHDDILSKLGKLAWQALQNDRLILNKVSGTFDRNSLNGWVYLSCRSIYICMICFLLSVEAVFFYDISSNCVCRLQLFNEVRTLWHNNNSTFYF